MSYVDFYLYVLSVTVMLLTPGPVMILVASAGLKGGYINALKTIIGTNFASLILILISILIIKGLFSVNEFLFMGIKFIGCLYIAYLGFEILKEVFQAKTQDIQKLSPIDGGMKKGFLVAISNPKDIIFFSSFFPQFIGIHSDINVGLMILIATWIILDFAMLSVVYLGFNKLSETQYYSKILALCGGILIFIAAYGLYSVFNF